MLIPLQNEQQIYNILQANKRALLDLEPF